MAEKSTSMGFTTPAGDFQQAYERLKDELKSTRANWEEAENLTIEVADLIVGVLESNPLTPGTATPADAAALFSLAALGYITKAGRQVTELHERLARLEADMVTVRRAVTK